MLTRNTRCRASGIVAGNDVAGRRGAQSWIGTCTPSLVVGLVLWGSRLRLRWISRTLNCAGRALVSLVIYLRRIHKIGRPGDVHLVSIVEILGTRFDIRSLRESGLDVGILSCPGDRSIADIMVGISIGETFF